MDFIKLQHTVVGASWDEDEALWKVRVRTQDGLEFEDTCNVLVNGGGVLKLVVNVNNLSKMANHNLLATGNGRTSKDCIHLKEHCNTVQIIPKALISLARKWL